MSKKVANLSIVLGPVRSGKTAFLKQAYRQSLERNLAETGLQSLWICPDQVAANEVRDSLLSTASEAFLGLQIATFAGFADSVVVNAGEAILLVSRLQKQRLLEIATEQCIAGGEIQHYGRVAESPGFQSQLGELIADFKRRDIWPEELASRSLRRNEQDIAAIYACYQQYLLNFKLYDAEGRFWAARRLLAEQVATQPGRQYSLVVVDGFTDFTSAQYDILGQIAQVSEEVRFSLTLENPSKSTTDADSGRELLFRKPRQTWNRLLRVFPNLEVQTLPKSQFGSAGLQHVAEQLYSEELVGEDVAPDSAGIEILAASSVQEEVEQVARRIKDLLGTGEARPQDIAVSIRNLDELSPRITEVFDDFGIPFHLESQVRLISTSLVRDVLLALIIQAEDWPFGELLKLVNNLGFRFFDDVNRAEESTQESLAKNHQIRSELERCIRMAQLPRGRQGLLDWIQNRVSAGSAQEIDEHKSAAEINVCGTVFQELAQQFVGLPDEAMLSDWIAALEDLLIRLGVLSGDNSTADTAIELAVWQQLKRGLLSVELIDQQIKHESQPIDIESFISRIETVARTLRLPAKSDGLGRVRVVSVDSLRHLSVKHLFAVGLGEQSFASGTDENPLFDTGRFDRQVANRVESEQGFDELEDEAVQQFYMLVTRATERLTLSYPAMDDKGQPLPPSPLLMELKRCFGKSAIQEQRSALGDFLKTDSRPQSEATFRQQAIMQALDGEPTWLAGMLQDEKRSRSAGALVNGVRCIAERGKREEFGLYEGLLESEAAVGTLARQFDSRHLWSASQLENYAACPFRFFGEQLLGLAPPEELALQSDARRRGSLLHQVLATVHQQMLEGPASSDPLQETLVQRFCETLQAIIERVPLFGLQNSLREIERREIESLAPQYAKQEEDYRRQWQHLDQPPEPALFEVRFGPSTRSNEDDESGPTTIPFELDLGDEKILLTGQIDRVDVGQVAGVTVFNIIDYKSGKQARLQVDKVLSGEQLQLPIYAMAAEQLLLVEQNAFALATGYWSVAGKGFQSGRSGALEVRKVQGQELQVTEQWQQLRPELLERVQQLVTGIRGGQFPVYSSNQHCTRSCNLATICRIAQVRSLEKQWDPVEVGTEE